MSTRKKMDLLQDAFLVEILEEMKSTGLSVHHASAYSLITASLDLDRVVLPVHNCRNVGKKDMKLNNETPHIEVDPETYKVTVDGEIVTSEPLDVVPLGQLYNLF